MGEQGGLLRVALVAVIAFVVTVVVQWRRRRPIADCIHRGVLAAIAVASVWVVLELFVFELKADNSLSSIRTGPQDILKGFSFMDDPWQKSG